MRTQRSKDGLWWGARREGAGHRQRHDPSKNLVGFVLGDVQYAVPIERVREISNPLVLVALPMAPPSICGVADYRGDVVPVIDLRVRFGLPPSEGSRKTKWVVVDLSRRHIALVVDAVTDVFGTGGADLRPAPPLGGGEDVRGIAGVTTRDGELVFVLELGKLRELTDSLEASGSIGPKAMLPSMPPKVLP